MCCFGPIFLIISAVNFVDGSHGTNSVIKKDSDNLVKKKHKKQRKINNK